jgi:hypothetical protein
MKTGRHHNYGHCRRARSELSTAKRLRLLWYLSFSHPGGQVFESLRARQFLGGILGWVSKGASTRREFGAKEP